jgi:membrane-associated phospholipid phosphatase
VDWRRLLPLAAVLLALYAVLGSFVASSPPGPLDRAALALRGHGVPLAVGLTEAATLPVYVGVCVVLLIFGFVRRDWLLRVVISVATLVAAWQTSDFFKLVFARPRMSGWIAIHETSFSYASGHATLSAAFYGLWACYLAASGHGRGRLVVAWLLVAFILAVGWARLALGAHYLSDVVGGYLLGAAFASLALAATGALAGSRTPA